jgi:dTMP kinase
MRRGRLITLEGGEGAGKSTQAARLTERLRRSGLEVVVTREPGGSPGAEEIRALLVSGSVDRWSAETETLLLYAARADHLQRTIRPALGRGAWVVCDRFADSTRAYQGAAGGASSSLLSTLEREILDGDAPDLTLMFDLPAEHGLARAASRGEGATRFEARDVAFHERLRQAFLEIARAEPDRCVVVDGRPAAEAVEGAVWAAVQARLQP